jgi:hypothetical protein
MNLKSFFCAAVFLSAATAQMTQASVFCDVLAGPGEVVMLNSGPNNKSETLVELKAEDAVQVGFDTAERKDGWEEVLFYPEAAASGDATPIRGWIETRFLSDICG